MRFGQLVVAYFLIGSVMWAGGAIAWSDAGVGNFLITADADEGTVEQSANTTDDLTELGGPIEEAASQVDGLGLLAVWNLLVKLIGYLTWPITVLQSVDAPVEIVVILGGTFQMAFFVSVIRVVRGSA